MVRQSRRRESESRGIASASVMKPGLDPEKQFFRQINPELEAHALPRRCMFLRGIARRELIVDIGREARAAQGLVKLYENGRFRPYRPTVARLPAAASSLDWYRGWRDHLEFAEIGV